MTFGVLKFLLIANIICRRFQDLNSHLTDELTVSKRLDVININEACNLLDLWSLHEQLSLAIKDLNSLYSLQLFLWISTIGFNIISRIYVFCTTILNKNFFWDLRETLLLIYFITLLAFLTITCHITAKQANKMSSIIFSPKYFQRSQQSSKVKLFMGHYLLKYCFNFTAAFGFFIVDIQLLLSIAGSITTYLVIIIGPNSL
ncbi:gustatory and pheromone receptor 32a-like [Leptopilina heterotoma]|uniref:gustatory and pheromone receptor 32a-like n=1 Tax=Leptopilina heterotoma TaxID=63436 RepID=UPI001CA9CE5E|nr:gustatory and pheromone receptor 32a-like [Leptopilina heterotoma]